MKLYFQNILFIFILAVLKFNFEGSTSRNHLIKIYMKNLIMLHFLSYPIWFFIYDK